VDKATLTTLISSIIGAVILALQGVNISKTQTLGTEGLRAEASISQELKAMQTLQTGQKERYDDAMQRFERIEASLARLEAQKTPQKALGGP
jgi:hypothetical protein